MKITSEQEMLAFGKSLAEHDPPHIIELVGDVGAGKTTFVRGFAEGLGIKTPVTSPSFTISKSYALPNGHTLTHYDFYRLKDPGIMAEDLAEKFKPGNIVIVEWGNSVADILPEDRTIININLEDDGSRMITIDNRKNTFRDRPRLTRSGLSEAPPVTTGRSERVEKSILRLFLDTSSETTILKLNDKTYEWSSGHDLAEKLLQFIHDKLQENGWDFHDISEIEFMSGPGSFTGLRIGATVVNALAHELNIPLFTHEGKKVDQIIPNYGREANITKPQK